MTTKHYDNQQAKLIAWFVRGFVQTSIFVVHTCPLVRRGIWSMIKDDPSLSFVGEAGDILNAVRQIHESHAHIAIVELADNLNGIHMCNIVKVRGMGTRILLLATTLRGEDVYNAVTAGAAGYLTCEERVKAIRLAIKCVAAGEVAISHTAQAAFQYYLQEQEVHARAKIDAQSPCPLLSAAELQVLRHTAKGLSIAETARLMYLSISTVKKHRQSLFAKLSVANAPAAVYTSIQLGILR